MKTELFTRFVVKCEDGTDNYFTMDEYAKDDKFGKAGWVKIELLNDWHSKDEMISYLKSVIKSLETL